MKIIVFDNHSLGAARRESRVTGLPNCQTDMRNCNWAATTRATGLAALEADSPDNPEKTLRNTPAGGGYAGIRRESQLLPLVLLSVRVTNWNRFKSDPKAAKRNLFL